MSYTNSPVGDIQFTTTAIGWTVCSGDVYKSVDKGSSWTKQQLPSVLYASSLFFCSELVGHVVARSGKATGNSIASTLDGGKSWNVSSLPNGFVPHAVHFRDKDNGWIGGQQHKIGAIAESKDGGETWQVYSTDIPATCYSLAFTNASSGCALLSNPEFWAAEVTQEVAYFDWIRRGRPDDVADEIWHDAERRVRSSHLLRTTDGGTTWLLCCQFRDAFFWWLSAINDKVIWVGGTKLMRTLDGGVGWQEFNQPGVGHFVSATHGCVGLNSGLGLVSHSRDGGDSWTVANLPANVVGAIRFRDENNAYAAAGNYSGTSSLLSSTDGGKSWSDIARL